MAKEDFGSTNSTIGYSPSGVDLTTFDFPYGSTNVEASTYIDSTTNLFYMNNVMHDVWYQYGFDEASGNFQANNYGLGGVEMNADAQDGSAKECKQCIFDT
jgi:hypothetical protein